jgi:hypothetical protein
MPLTDAACRNAKCPEGRAFRRVSDAGGLYLEVTRSASKLWRWKYRYLGKEKRLALGVYPAVGLVAARKARDEARMLLAAGTDPNEAKRDARRAGLMKSDTAFEKIARQWWSDWSANKADQGTLSSDGTTVLASQIEFETQPMGSM